MFRYLLLFQSWAQLQKWFLLILPTIVIINEIVIYFGLKVLPLQGVLLGAVLGSLCSVAMVVPAEFVLSSCSVKLFDSVKSEIESLGYGQRESANGLTIYQQKLPKILRWEEGEVSVEEAGADVYVRGAFIIVLKVQRSVLRCQENEYAQ
jgi:hypothetical protein